MKKIKKAFTMTELIFVIVIIGILAAVAVPRLAATRDDAEIAKGRTVVASIRNALAMERQKRILRGNFTVITSVGGNVVGTTTNVFSIFSDDGKGNTADVLEYAMVSSLGSGRWSFASDTYTFHQSSMGDVDFTIVGGKFECDMTTSGCNQLTN